MNTHNLVMPLGCNHFYPSHEAILARVDLCNTSELVASNVIVIHYMDNIAGLEITLGSMPFIGLDFDR